MVVESFLLVLPAPYTLYIPPQNVQSGIRSLVSSIISLLVEVDHDDREVMDAIVYFYGNVTRRGEVSKKHDVLFIGGRREVLDASIVNLCEVCRGVISLERGRDRGIYYP